MTNKYHLDLNTTTTAEGKTLYRVVANHDLTTIAGNITSGTAGGYVESEANLQQDITGVKSGNLTYTSWISAGKVFDNAKITEGAVVGSATALIHGDAVLGGVCNITGNADIKDKARLMGNVTVLGNAEIFEGATLTGTASVAGNSSIFGNARVEGAANLSDSVTLFGNAIVKDNVTCAGGNSTTYSQAVIYGDAVVSGNYTLTARQIVKDNTKLTA